ncbi:hypothetical protein HYPSUDRAFT_46146 [Hypholoma sublateritium FD-334 SS-4]|uniref:F-box domain-containing protein n=1 Tax=Hypholoma sublateritium (strain FD-334 SS-4) TaxID=945553 RepID=A0A0D2PBL8_HYPSF|nr:hypothetical protein HYPSUDRAFT_46146 [Hypholoma sublateritium FD-334 SS-4]
MERFSETKLFTGNSDAKISVDAKFISKPTLLFSQEVIEQFIDHLHDNKEALRECALVCRAWVPRSRYHLFESVTISPPRSTPIDGRYPFSDLIASLNHPLCTFASSVRKISISDPEYIVAWGAGSRKMADSNWINPFALHLDKLRSVTLLDVTLLHRVTVNCFKSITLIKPTFAIQITHLVLDVSYFPSRQSKEIMKIIHSFSSLAHLQIEYDNEDTDSHSNSWVSTDTTVSLEVLPSKQLKELVIYSHETVEIPLFIQLLLLWFRESQTRISTLSFSTLSIKSDDEIITTSPNPLARYLKFLGPSLKSLALTFNDFASIRHFHDSFEITQNTRINVLEVGYPKAFNTNQEVFEDLHFYSKLLPTFLSRVPTTTLTRIILNLWIQYLDQGFMHSVLQVENLRLKDTVVPWFSLDDLLIGPSFSVLTEVIFHVYRYNSFPWFEAKKYVESRLPKCKERGLLHIITI